MPRTTLSFFLSVSTHEKWKAAEERKTFHFMNIAAPNGYTNVHKYIDYIPHATTEYFTF